ncbi:MAG: PorV/PorQ family protein [Candidatus Eisenbacteria bacterium]
MRRSWSVLSLLLVAAGAAGAAPVGLRSMLIDPGVAASGMGYAYTAVADDPSALYWTPAGLTRGAQGQDLLLAHTEWFVDHRMEYAVVSWNRGADAFAAGITGFYVGGIERREEDPTAEPFGDFGAYDLVVSLAYARAWGPLRAGLAAKPFYSKIDRVSAHGVAVDFGLQADTPVDNLTIGGAIANVGNEPYYVEERFSLPLDLRGGAAYRIPLPAEYGDLLVSGEARKTKDENARTHFGADLRLSSGISFRFGYKLGYEEEDYAFGIGVARGFYSIQYAVVPFQSDFGNVHRFALVFHRDK